MFATLGRPKHVLQRQALYIDRKTLSNEDAENAQFQSYVAYHPKFPTLEFVLVQVVVCN